MTRGREFSERVISAHGPGSQYYNDAESWNDAFWSQPRPFRDLFEKLDLTKTVDLACGHGRHTAQFVDRCGGVTLVDANQANIDACKRRFAGCNNVNYYTTSGSELKTLETESYTSLFSFDAMVHFESLDVIAYLHEIRRILKPQARALLHFSNYDTFPERTFNENVHWRNFFSEKMMRHFASRLSFEIEESRIFEWPLGDGVKDLDAVMLMRKT